MFVESLFSSSDYHLQSKSPAIGKGLTISGLSNDFDGNQINSPPCIGAYEYLTAALPVYQNSFIDNASPSVLEIDYNLPLANIIPDISSFNVLVNSIVRAVNSVTISGTKVLLRLESPVVYADVVKISYTKPSSNPLQTSDGGVAVSYAAKTVTNNCISTIPVYVASTVENSSPSEISMTYSLNLAGIIPSGSAFNVLVNSVARAVNTVTVSGTKVLLTLGSPVVYSDVVTISYTIPSVSPLQTPEGGQAVSFTAKSVTNNCLSTVPVYVSSVVENSSPSVLVVSYNIGLSGTIPAISAFNVLVNSVSRNINLVTISGTKVQLVLGSAIKPSDIITFSYTKPVVNQLQSTNGGQAASIIGKSVVNNCVEAVKTNDPPVVLINYPITVAAGFVSEIDASSTYDPNKDPLIAIWNVSKNVSIATATNLKTEFLAPVVDNSEIVNFELKVSDGITLVTKDLPITVLPYKPESMVARITSIETSSYQASDIPTNIIDGNTSTKWSSNGDNQWLLIKLADPFKISHIVMAFLDGQSYESYFDIFASNDNIIWDHILSGVASCKFSGKRQIFDFPEQFSDKQYSFVKYIGHGNSLNSLNIVSEFKVFGILQKSTTSVNTSGHDILIYPNPAQNFLNIAIEDPSINPNSIRILDYTGKIILEDSFNQRTNRIELPSSIDTGIYIVEFRSGMITLDSQKLFVRR